MFYYTGFGLTIASELQFPELVPIEIVSADVSIEVGITPGSIVNASFADTEYSISPTQYLQHIDGVASYYAEFGKKIIIEPVQGSDPKSIRIFLLCSCMAAIVHQRGMIPLHASGILTKTGATLIIGDSGAGKSTTIKALSRAGHTIFTDDICVIRYQGARIEGAPSYPIMKLWENSFALLNLEDAKGDDRLWPNVEKFGVNFRDEFVSTWQSIDKLFILEKSGNVQTPLIQSPSGIEAFVAVGANTYRGWYVEPMGMEHVHFSIVNQLIKQCEVYTIMRPTAGDSVQDVVQLISERL